MKILTCRLNNVISTGLRPFDVGRVALLVETDGLAVDGQVAAGDLDLTLELAMGRVIFQPKKHVISFALVKTQCL